ncbi:uncharacterized protein HMPREF1541_08369 [Cyphellophora europaea CBS 101466]|uniref:DNA mismatch repair protein S5 domain-containing protein n=1 Tax=Cyphellophora europaea (strain CBS 101466) TaxID=1220924 RepID=W2RNX9_CYPE1|nr:uncharacterized protein HMPREF1541_08369 [Cyphellophora europaea CBS 101466]ETN37378.1 hypothetical protein HMPREF1541_08369 [Cyphellophora europaea CBS 101466]
MPISALPQDTARVITSSVALNDAVSLVKELVDNALDARANTIAVEISANTIDVIQVKDNGTGIGVEDRQLLCKRGCTSKIRTIDDLASLGGSFLGFRGEALASATNISSSLLITTRVEGEVVGSALKYGMNGKMISSASASHSVGTTVRVQDFLSNIPVRKQTALKAAGKILTNVRKLLFTYAFARPEARFTLKVLKGKNDKANWSYAPGSVGPLQSETASKVVGQDVAMQTKLHTIASGEDSDEPDDLSYRIEALLIDPSLTVAKACGAEQYFSVDKRPISAERDLMKRISKLYKNYLRDALPADDSSSVSKPFMCVRVFCPPESYDVNVEPTKDCVMFYRPNIVFDLFEKLLRNAYGEIRPSEAAITTPVDDVGPVKPVSSFDILLARKSDAREQSNKQFSASAGDTSTDIPIREAEMAIHPQSDDARRGGSISDEEAGTTLDNPWTKAKMNVRLVSNNGDASTDVDSGAHVISAAESRLQASVTPNRLPLGTSIQLPTPDPSPGITSQYQNPGPPIQRRTTRNTHSDDDSPPPTEPRRDTLLDSWVQASQRESPRGLLDRLPSSPVPPLSNIELGQASSTSRQMSDEKRTLSSSHRLSTGGQALEQVRRPLVPPFKRPQPSDFSESDHLGVSNGSNKGFLELSHGHLHPRSAGQHEQELDEILEFERQKKAVSQQHRAAIKGMRQRSAKLNFESPADVSVEAEYQRREALLTTLTEEGMPEDFGARFNERADLSTRCDQSTLVNGSAGSTPTPHRNRAIAAVRSLGHAHPSSDKANDIDHTEGRSSNMVRDHVQRMPDTDPRSCLIRQRGGRGVGSVGSTGTKVSRVRTTNLPFEVIPEGEELFDLALIADVHGTEYTNAAQAAANLCNATSKLLQIDEYVLRGCVEHIHWIPNGKDVELWEQRLQMLVQTRYQPNRLVGAEEIESSSQPRKPQAFAMDLALGTTLKAHVDENGV